MLYWNKHKHVLETRLVLYYPDLDFIFFIYHHIHYNNTGHFQNQLIFYIRTSTYINIHCIIWHTISCIQYHGPTGSPILSSFDCTKVHFPISIASMFYSTHIKWNSFFLPRIVVAHEFIGRIEDWGLIGTRWHKREIQNSWILLYYHDR